MAFSRRWTESRLFQRQLVRKVAGNPQRHRLENTCSWRCGVELHHQLPEQRLLLRLPVRRQRDEEHGGRHRELDRDRHFLHLGEGEHRLFFEHFVQLGKFRRRVLHVAQPDQTDDRVVVLLLCSNRALNHVFGLYAVHHRPHHRLALQCS